MAEAAAGNAKRHKEQYPEAAVLTRQSHSGHINHLTQFDRAGS